MGLKTGGLALVFGPPTQERTNVLPPPARPSFSAVGLLKPGINQSPVGKDERKNVFFSQLFRPKVFDIDFPQKVFYGVFELPLLRNAQKRHQKNLKN
jgi:hypothetical protein